MITLETFERLEADDNIILWFETYMPNGGEIADIFNHNHITYDVLHWIYTNISTTDEEKALYWEKTGIQCDENLSVYESDRVINSAWVSRSSRVNQSQFIFSSKDVDNSNSVLSSADIFDSYQVYGSEFVYTSNRVLQSRNVTNSHNIVDSDYVVNSHSIAHSATVTNSKFVDGWLPGGTKQIKDSRFIMDCSNLKKCLFCNHISDGEYLIFNKPVDASDYELILLQLDKLLGEFETELVVEGYWPKHTIPLDTPTIQRNITKQYNNIPESFWRWVKTLPGYDPAVLYAITYNSKLM
jgi:hypothetical protein